MSDQRRDLLAFARELNGVTSIAELVERVCKEVQRALGYNSAWLYLLSPDGTHLRFAGMVGSAADMVTPEFAVPVGADPYIDAVLSASGPVVVEDAQVDPTVNRELVEQLGNRTIINVPMHMVGLPVGTLGCGTFGEEGVRVPSAEDLRYLEEIGLQVVVASARIAVAESKEQAAVEREKVAAHLAQRERLESLGLLAGGIAHDFNNLLTIILASAQMLRRNGREETLAEIDAIEDASERAAEMTRRLLSISREQPVELHLFDVNERLLGLERMLNRVASGGVQIDLIQAQHLPRVLGDPSQLDQVFLNLALNAIDAMDDDGRLTIESESVLINGDYVRTHPWAKSGRYVLVSVSDTGVGMAPETMERIFEPFFTTKGRESGTGIGLAVSYGTVVRHGGMMHAYSEVGVGSTLKVYIPAADRSASSVGPKLDGKVRGGSEHILLADDQPDVRSAMAKLLRAQGYRVSEVSDGQAAVHAVETAENDDFQLIVLDAVMPVMGGREAFDAIQQIRPTLPVIFTSGYGAEELNTRFLAGLRLTVVPKPSDPDTLLRAVRFALDEE